MVAAPPVPIQAPPVVAAAVRGARVLPAVGGPQSTFRIVFRPGRTDTFSVELDPRCGSAYPWTQWLQLAGPPFTNAPAVIQFPRPLGGWCAARFRGTISQVYPRLKVVARFSFRVKPHVRTPLPERPCRPHGAVTVRQTRAARIFTVQVGRLVFTDGCLFSARTHIQLARGLGFGVGDEAEQETLGWTALAGPYAGYVHVYPGPAEPEVTVEVSDLRSGKRMWSYEPGNGASNLLMTGDGTLAWIDNTYSEGVFIRQLNADGMTVLASGDGIDPGYLRLSGHTLSWMRNGQIESATT